MACYRGEGALRVRECFKTLTGHIPNHDEWRAARSRAVSEQKKKPCPPEEAAQHVREMFTSLGMSDDEIAGNAEAASLIADVENGTVTLTTGQAEGLRHLSGITGSTYRNPDADPIAAATLADAVDPAALAAAIDRGHVRVVDSDEYPYRLYNYTEACTWENGWDEATLACRGLIINRETGEIVARPYAKFFNHGQEGAPEFGLDDPVVVMDKVDGSLGVSYLTPNGDLKIATRGSFSSDQAKWASEFYAQKYAGTWNPNPNRTYLFEIIYPENRVVVDYGDTTDLIMLGAVDKTTGKSIHIHDAVTESGWAGPSVDVYPHTTLREVLEAPERPNAEGFVLWNTVTDDRIKVKQEDYKRLHRFLTNTSEKNVWEVLSSGMDPEEHFKDAPDEFHTWLKEVITTQRTQFNTSKAAAIREYSDTVANLDAAHGSGNWGRKDFALTVKSASNPGWMFLLLDADGKEETPRLDEKIWSSLKPRGSSTVRQVSTDAD